MSEVMTNEARPAPALGFFDYIGKSVPSKQGDYWQWRETVNGVHGGGGFCVTREWVWPDGNTCRTDYPTLSHAESVDLALRIDAWDKKVAEAIAKRDAFDDMLNAAIAKAEARDA